MKKVIIYSVIFFVVGMLLSPVLGMAIGETRNIILGLAPHEAVLSLADEIDKSRIENETKIQELQVLVEQQKSELESQKMLLEKEKREVAIQQVSVEKRQDTIDYCLKSNELFVHIPAKPSGGCSRMGPNNIVDMYKEIKDGYDRAKNKDDDSEKCFKKYLDVLEPAYNKYLEAKKLCP